MVGVNKVSYFLPPPWLGEFIQVSLTMGKEIKRSKRKD